VREQARPRRPADGFDAAWAHGEEIPGWLTRDQARLLWDSGLRVPAGGTVLEIGSHQGRSTVVLALAARRVGARVVAVDPFVSGRLFGGPATRLRFQDNVARAEVGDVVELMAQPSTQLRPGWTGRIDLLYVDGKHDYWTVADDLRWADHLPAGAVLLVHDAFSSVGVTLGVLRWVLPSGRIAYTGRVGSLARFAVGSPGLRDRARILAELPWFVRNLAVKIGLRGLRPVGRLTGRAVPPDPY
jgi:predicted O-methyltransferase YrrM